MSPELWALLGVLVTQITSMFINYRNNKTQSPLIEAQAEDAMSEGWVKLAGEYARQIESLKKLEVENSELRPLVLKIALQEKDTEQHMKDKADWKKYSMLLVKQIEDLGQVPMPFIRYMNGDTGKHKTVSITQPKIETPQ